MPSPYGMADREMLEVVSPRAAAPPHEEFQALAEAKIDVAAALDEAGHTEEHFLQFPYRALASLLGGLSGGQVWFVCGFRAKTTFLLNLVDAWLTQGLRLYGMALETATKDVRSQMAAIRAGVDFGAVKVHKASETDRAKHRIALREMDANAEELSRLMLHPATFVDPRNLRQAMARAERWGADIFFVDHIDHLRPGRGSTYEQSVDLAAEMHERALAHGLIAIASTQLNDAKLRGMDKLARYQAPRPEWVHMGQHKYNVATGMLGLFRPIRRQRPSESDETYKRALQDAREGRTTPHPVLEEHALDISIMKGRYVGLDEGREVRLRYDQGRLSDFEPRLADRTARAGTQPARPPATVWEYTGPVADLTDDRPPF